MEDPGVVDVGAALPLLVGVAFELQAGVVTGGVVVPCGGVVVPWVGVVVPWQTGGVEPAPTDVPAA